MTCHAQGVSKKVLFLGNSYTGVNNLPQMVSDVAISVGDTLHFDSNTPGGHTLQGHATNAASRAKIAIGHWDFVVLQEQSQLPSFSASQVQLNVFPFARQLDSLINVLNPCAETVFYMTWGRKNGDASNCAAWPPVCTYAGMDSLLQLRYRMMADSNDAILSPVGAVWNYLRQQFPLLELYQADESHPSLAGTYAAACSFYAVLFRKDPMLITYHAGLSSNDALAIRSAVKTVVYDNLTHWNVGPFDPVANFGYTVSAGNQVTFNNLSSNSAEYFWDFGDGTASTSLNPVHHYASPGDYTVMLVAKRCALSDTLTIQVTVANPLGLSSQSQVVGLKVHPNPAQETLFFSHDFTGGLNFKIVHVTGQVVQSGMLSARDNQIQLLPFRNGLYLLELFDLNHQLLGCQKFIKSNSRH